MERRYDLDKDWKFPTKTTKAGHKADKTFSRKGCPIKPGEWIVSPYSKYRIEFILNAIKKGLIVKSKDNGNGRYETS